MQTFFERMENFRSPAHRLGETARADRHYHEFLKIYWIISVFSTIYDIHHWHRQDMGGHTTNIAIERQPSAVRSRFGGRETDAQNSIRTQAALVLRTIERDRSEEHTSELQSLMRISYAVFCLKKKQQST